MEKIIRIANRIHRIIEIVGEIVILIIGMVPVKKKLMNLQPRFGIKIEIIKIVAKDINKLSINLFLLKPLANITKNLAKIFLQCKNKRYLVRDSN